MPETNDQAPPSFDASGQPSLQQLVDYGVDAASSPGTLGRFETAVANAFGRGLTVAELAAIKTLDYVVGTLATPVVLVIVKTLLDVIASAEPLTSGVAKVALDAVLGDGPARAGVPAGVGQKIIDKLAPASASVEPSIDGAAHYMDIMVNLQMETWLLGFMAEVFGDAIDLERGAGATMRTVAELRDVITQVFGGSRITRRVLSPFIDDGIVQPAKRWTSQKYRPQLLPVAAAIESYLRGDWDLARLTQEAAQQGWSDDRITLQIENARKRLTLDDLIFRFDRGELSDVDVVSEARSLGYGEDVARAKMAIDNQQRIDELQKPIITEAVSSYIAGDIDAIEMERWVRGAAPNTIDADRMVATATARRGLHRKRITVAELRALVKDGIASIVDFRQRLERDGYPDDDVTLLELQLRFEMDKATTIEQHKEAIAAERDAEKAKAAADKAERDAEIAAKKARGAFPPLSDYRAGYVHGLIDRDALAAALTREGIVEDQDLYLGDADVDRETYLAAQEQRAKAEAKAAASGLSIAVLEQAVIGGVLSLAEFDADLSTRGVSDDDRRVLTGLLQVKLDAAAAAAQKQKDADARAAAKGVSNADYVRAVRLGVRSLDDYGTFLDAIGTPDVAKALLLDTLRAQLAQDDATAAKRADRDAAAAQQGISLDERRRAVIAGLRPRSWYAAAIEAAGWPVDDQLADLDLLDVEIANAAAVKAKRDVIAKAPPNPTVSLSQLESAFKLGALSQDELTAALTARGYSADDAAMIVQLAVLTIPNVRAGATDRAAVIAQQTGKDAPIADFEKAVRRGLQTSADYEAEILRRGYSEDQAALMRELLDEQVTVDFDGLRTKISAAIAKGTSGATLDEIVGAFTSGELDAAQLQAALVEAGASADAALVFSRLVATFGAEG